MHQEFYTIKKLLDYALFARARLGKGVFVAGKFDLTLAQAIGEAVGTQTMGFRITIDHGSILHVFRRHGQEATEQLRGQLPVEEADILALSDWLTSPDSVQDAGQKLGEVRCLRFLRAHNNELTMVVLSIRTARFKQQLSLKTMYKKRLAT